MNKSAVKNSEITSLQNNVPNIDIEQDKEPWIRETYLSKKILPENKKDSKTIILTSKDFFLDESSDILYRLYLQKHLQTYFTNK